MLKRIGTITLALILAGSPMAALDPVSGVPRSTAEIQSDMTIRREVGEVRLGFHVSSRNGRPAVDVRKDQISVFQDGQPVPEIAAFYSDQDLPLRLVLMVDSSDSMSRGFDSERSAAEAFLQRVVRPKMDRSAVATFSTHTAVEVETDPSSPNLLRRIQGLRASGLTALFDAICEVGARIPEFDRQPGLTRRVVILLSDGDDTYSRHSLDDAITVALRSDIVIYAVASHNPRNPHWGDANLQELTGATGGRVFFLKKYEQSDKIFAEIERELRSQYTVTFRPEGSPCGFHSLGVRAKDRSLKIRSRTGYFGDC